MDLNRLSISPTGDTLDTTVRQGESKSWLCHSGNNLGILTGKTTVYCYLHFKHKEFFDD